MLSRNDPMFQCHVCGSTHAPEERVNAAFQINGEPTFKRPSNHAGGAGGIMGSKRAVT